jgi:hypothetical protein
MVGAGPELPPLGELAGWGRAGTNPHLSVDSPGRIFRLVG